MVSNLYLPFVTYKSEENGNPDLKLNTVDNGTTAQFSGILRFSCSFQTILPPDEQYGFPFSSGKSN